MTFTDQIKAQEKKRMDLAVKRGKEKEEKGLSEQDIVDAYIWSEDQRRNNHHGGTP